MADERHSTPVLEGAIMLLVVALLVPAGVVGWVIGHSGKASTRSGPVAVTTTANAVINPEVASGGHLFVQFACAQCHGPQGRGGISPDVPALTSVGKAL